MQVSDKERKLHYDSLFKDIAGVLVAKCVNADTNRPYTISMLERSLHDIHFAVDPKRPAKQQALEVLEAQLLLHYNRHYLGLRALAATQCCSFLCTARRSSERPWWSCVPRAVQSCDCNAACATPPQAIPELQKVIPIRRARMRLKLQVPPSAEHELEQLLRKQDAVIENQSVMQAQVLQP